MALAPKQQLCELIKKSSNPLILMPQNPEGDAISGALALFLTLKKMNKKAEIACSTALAEKFLFLPDSNSVKHSLSAEYQFKISLDVASNVIKELSYDQDGSLLNIYLSVEDGDIGRDSLSIEPAKFKYDLILVLSSPDLESIGRIYFENTDLFFQTPIANIDHHASNECFGAVNIIDVTSPSTSEIIADIIKTLAPDAMDASTATLILAGIISETNNFQNPNINPETFIAAASLLTNGAAQEEIIRNFYKTKPLAVLKLVGQIINHMDFDTSCGLAWARFSHEDFEKNETSPKDIDAAVNELVNNSKDIDMLLITYGEIETPIADVWFDKKYDAVRLAAALGGEKNLHKITVAKSRLPQNDLEKEILKKLKVFIEQSKKNPAN